MTERKVYRNDASDLVDRIQNDSFSLTRINALERDKRLNEIHENTIPASMFVRFVAWIFKRFVKNRSVNEEVLLDTANHMAGLELSKVMTQITLVKSDAGVYVFGEGYDLSKDAQQVENLTTVAIVTPPEFEELEWTGHVDEIDFRKILELMMSVIQVTEKGQKDTYRRTEEHILHDAQNKRIRLYPKSDEIRKNKVIESYLESVITGNQSFVVRVSHCIDVVYGTDPNWEDHRL